MVLCVCARACDGQVPTNTLKEELMTVFKEEAQIMADLDKCEKELEEAGADMDAMQKVLAAVSHHSNRGILFYDCINIVTEVSHTHDCIMIWPRCRGSVCLVLSCVPVLMRR